jgi:hypothetical protein
MRREYLFFQTKIRNFGFLPSSLAAIKISPGLLRDVHGSIVVYKFAKYRRFDVIISLPVKSMGLPGRMIDEKVSAEMNISAQSRGK